jgi:hypothetical protein
MAYTHPGQGGSAYVVEIRIFWQQLGLDAYDQESLLNVSDREILRLTREAPAG